MGRKSDNSLRDVVALSTLPAIWTGADPLRVAESLAAAVFTMLDPEFVYVSFVLGGGSPPVDIIQTGRYTTDHTLAEQIAPAVLGWARAHDPDDLLTLKLPGRPEGVRLATRPIGLNAELGVMAAAFAGGYNPSPADLLLLNVAATQAAVAVQNATLLQSLQSSELRVNRVAEELAHRLGELETANAQIRESRLAAIQSMQGAVQARDTAETLNRELRNEIAQRKLAEQALRESEARLRQLAESLPHLVWTCDADGFCDYLSPQWAEYTGIPEANQLGYGWLQQVKAEDRERLVREWTAAVRSSGTFDVEFRIRRHDGKYRWFKTRAVPARNESNRVVKWFGSNTDIEDLRVLQEALRESDRRERARAGELQAILDAVPVAMFVSQDPDCRDMLGSRLTYEMLRLPPGADVSMSARQGQAPKTFRTMRDGREIPPEDLPAQKAAATGQPVRNYEFDLVYEDGARRSMLGDAVPLFGEDGRPRGVVGAFVDITERKRNEERLRQAQKLESIGLLAGGVAHDFNNLLIGVIGNASLIQEMLLPNDPASELVEGIVKTGEQLAHLTRQMLAYAGKGRFYMEVLDISAVVRDIGDLVRPSISKKVVLHFDLLADLPRIEADRGQVQQVLLNLVINAAEAISGGDSVITVATAAQIVDAAFIRAHPGASDLQPGEYVVLEVRDTGCGMDDAVKAKIFDPFFSTKFTGRGLGLAAVGGIVRGHKGAILVSSEPGKGSTFTVLFPATGRKTERSQAVAIQDTGHGSGMVLVIDDEQVVRQMAKRALERNGYSVLVAYGGLAAIDILRRHPGKIDVAVLDLSMPGMSGEETLPEFRKIRPDVKVLVSSGYSEAEAMAMFRGQKVSGFVQKPYTAAVLAEKVKTAMGGASLLQPQGKDQDG